MRVCLGTNGAHAVVKCSCAWQPGVFSLFSNLTSMKLVSKHKYCVNSQRESIRTLFIIFSLHITTRASMGRRV